MGVCEQSVRLVPDEDPNVTMERHMHESCAGQAVSSRAGKKARCPVRGCKQQLTFSNKVQCGKCCQTTCLRHRFEEDHECTGVVHSVAAAAVPGRARPVSRLVLAF